MRVSTVKNGVYCLLGLLAVACFCSASNALALEQQSEVDVNFTFTPFITLIVSDNLIIDNLMPGNSADSNVITVGVSTNNLNGYYLSATAGTSSTDARLNNTAAGTYFASLTGNVSSMASASDNTWGYSYSTDNGANWISGNINSALSGYNGLPLDNDDNGATGVALADTATFINNQSIKFKIAAKAASYQAAGTYTNTVNFYAVAYPEPEPDLCNPSGTTIGTGNDTDILCMQDFSASNASSIKSSMTPNQQYQLIDKRDNNIYNITKIDGVCWMSTNLNLGDSVPMELTPDDTNIGSNYTLPASSISGFSVSSVPNVYKSGSTICGDGQPCYAYYNYNAASVNTTPVDATVAYDICPKGWRLPSYSEYDDLITEYSSTAAIISSPFRGVNGGLISFGQHFSGGRLGMYWSSRSYDQYTSVYMTHDLEDEDTPQMSSWHDTFEGASIRCVTAN